MYGIIVLCLGDGTHSKKQQAHTARGMIPIEKNIVVVDENGIVYESTWPKRANGLVKKGRARWLDEHTICLACPPEQMEDNEMENFEQAEAVTERIAEPESMEPKDPRLGNLTIEGLIERMDAIRKEMVWMSQICSTMENISNQGSKDEAGHVAEATSQAFVARETTCQQQLRFLEKIYDDYFSGRTETSRASQTRMLLEQMTGTLSACSNSPDAIEAALKFYGDLLKQA